MLSQERWWRWVAALRHRSVPCPTGTMADHTKIREDKCSPFPSPHIADIQRTLEFLSRTQRILWRGCVVQWHGAACDCSRLGVLQRASIAKIRIGSKGVVTRGVRHLRKKLEVGLRGI